MPAVLSPDMEQGLLFQIQKRERAHLLLRDFIHIILCNQIAVLDNSHDQLFFIDHQQPTLYKKNGMVVIMLA